MTWATSAHAQQTHASALSPGMTKTALSKIAQGVNLPQCILPAAQAMCTYPASRLGHILNLHIGKAGVAVHSAIQCCDHEIVYPRRCIGIHAWLSTGSAEWGERTDCAVPEEVDSLLYSKFYIKQAQ